MKGYDSERTTTLIYIAGCRYGYSPIGAIVGHKGRTTTSRYIHSADAVLLSAADAIADQTDCPHEGGWPRDQGNTVQARLNMSSSANTGLVALGALLICASAGLLSVVLGPDNYWDLRFYHLYAPWAYLHERYLYDVAPAEWQSYFNPAADFLFYGLTSSILNGTPRIIAFIMGAVHGLNVVLVVAIAKHVLRPREPWARVALCTAATLIGVSGAGFVPLLGTTSRITPCVETGSFASFSAWGRYFRFGPESRLTSGAITSAAWRYSPQSARILSPRRHRAGRTNGPARTGQWSGGTKYRAGALIASCIELLRGPAHRPLPFSPKR